MSQRPRILLADDDDAEIAHRKQQLASTDCQIDVAIDGSQALECAERLHPDLILLNVTLPGVSGIEVCRRIKASPATGKTVILMIATQTDLDEIDNAIAAGTDDFLARPVNETELVRRVGLLLKLRGVS